MNGKGSVEEDIATISRQRQDAIAYAANLETIRINRWREYSDRAENTGTLDTGSQALDLKVLKPGWIYVVTNIVAIEIGSGTPQVKLGFLRQAHHHILTCRTVVAAENSVEYVGQAILWEGDIIRAVFESAGATDSIYLYANGYKIRR